ncbi:MAG: hypothetical protein JRJ29_01505 [Deltaproteobacteria bacterium]|nr:hypothetical protein [Deltaproteobacteria bacterium]
MKNDLLHKRFAEAGLKAEVTDERLSFGPNIFVDNEAIFQMDIASRRRKGRVEERFRISPGDPNNRVEVLSVDPNLRQVVLLVHEPARKFTVTRWRRGRAVESVQDTPALKRHILCGFDERHLFISNLPRGVTTVRDAHEALKDPEQVPTGAKGAGRPIRQGEFFFVDATDEEREFIDMACQNVVLRKVAIENRGTPHVADELVRALGAVFVRGKVRHPEHKTVRFNHWRRVVRNLEPVEDRNRVGIAWVD